MSQHPLAFWSLSTTDILRQLQMAKAFAYHKQEAYTIAQRLSCIAGTIPTRRIGIIGSERWEPAWGGSGQSTATTPCSATLEGPRSYRILCEKLDLMLDPARCTIAQPLSCISCTIPLHT